MRRTTRTVLLPAIGLLSLGAAVTTAHAQYMVYGLASGGSGVQQLVRFNSSNPSDVTVIGLTGASLRGIDFRPANGVLYGIDGSQVYTVNTTTGGATLVATLTAGATGTNVGFDFNPMADRIRIVDASGNNLRVNPDNGVTIVDGAYTYAAGDVSTGAPAFSGVAYTNSVAGPTSTALYGIDGARGTLVSVGSPNGGTVSTVGSLGLTFNPTVVGFDVVTVGGANLGFFSALTAGAISNFYSVNLTTGAATLVGSVSSAGGIQGLAIAAVPEPGTWALMVTGLAGLGAVARRRTRRQRA